MAVKRAAFAKKHSSKKRKVVADSVPGAETKVEEERPQPEEEPVGESASTPVKASSEAGGSDDDEAEEKSDDEAGDGPPRKSKARRLQEAMDKGVGKPKIPRGVIYLGRIPKGFAEPEMKAYFTQFGTITRMKLARSKKNAHSKGYAFIEFEDVEVAKIVAETMDNYMLFEQNLKCFVMPTDDLHANVFKNWKRKIHNNAPKRREAFRSDYNDRPTVKVDDAQVPRTTGTQKERRYCMASKLKAKLERFGVSYSLTEETLGVPSRQKKRSEKPARGEEEVKEQVKEQGASDVSVAAIETVSPVSASEALPAVSKAAIAKKAAKKKKRVAA